MEITEVYKNILDVFTINNEISLIEIIKGLFNILCFILIFPSGRYIFKKYSSYKNEKIMKKNVQEDLLFIMDKLKSKNFILIISDNTVSEKNMYAINKYFEFLKDKGSNEANDYLSIKNLFEKNEQIKSKLYQYINVRNGGVRKSDLMQDPDFGILCKNYTELEHLISKKILAG